MALTGSGPFADRPMLEGRQTPFEDRRIQGIENPPEHAIVQFVLGLQPDSGLGRRQRLKTPYLIEPTKRPIG